MANEITNFEFKVPNLFMIAYCFRFGDTNTTYGSLEKDPYHLKQGIYRYGKAKIKINILYDDDGAITDVIFDLNDVYEKYAVGGKVFYLGLNDFVDEIRKNATKKFVMVKEVKIGEFEDYKYGLAIAWAEDKSRVMEYYHLADIVKDVNEALDKVLELHFNTITTEESMKMITKKSKSVKKLLGFLLTLVVATIGFVVLSIINLANIRWLWIVFSVIFGLGSLFFTYVFKLARDEFNKGETDDLTKAKKKGGKSRLIY